MWKITTFNIHTLRARTHKRPTLRTFTSPRMSLKIKRSQTAHEETLITHDGAGSSTWLLPEEGYSVLERRFIRNAAEWKNVPIDKNPLVPPYHWHWYQTEYFNIKKGRFVFLVEGQEFVYDETSPKISVPPTARHRYWADPSYDGECEVHISASPARGLDEKFYRNLYSYLNDCERQKVKPSLPQLLLFCDSAEFSIAFPGPALLMRWLSWMFGVVVGRWYGGLWLGLKTSYDEYFDENRAKTR
ncbi:hypothetical protein F5884DRAFT_269711 [Xylogone sp. PMI_703]|nr:hypothetical protein F5884DRAFT_269711 [Xylogone sp. PMI_703]